MPAGTALGLAFGWRSAFWALIPIGIIAAICLLRLVPSQPATPQHLEHEFKQVFRLPVQLVLAISTLSSVSLFCVLTYIAPLLESVTHLSPHAVTWVLVIFGAGITVGNLLGGWLSDWKQMPAILGGFALLVVAFIGMRFSMTTAIPAVLMVFVWGLIHFGASAPLQPRIVDQARGANLASTLNQSAFNFGNAIGASLGGLVLARGYGYLALPFLSAGIAALALIVGLIALAVQRSRPNLLESRATA